MKDDEGLGDGDDVFEFLSLKMCTTTASMSVLFFFFFLALVVYFILCQCNTN